MDSWIQFLVYRYLKKTFYNFKFWGLFFRTPRPSQKSLSIWTKWWACRGNVAENRNLPNQDQPNIEAKKTYFSLKFYLVISHIVTAWYKQTQFLNATGACILRKNKKHTENFIIQNNFFKSIQLYTKREMFNKNKKKSTYLNTSFFKIKCL